MLKPRPNSGPVLILVKSIKTAFEATVPFSLLLLDLRTGPEQRRIPKVSRVTKNLQKLHMSLEHLTLYNFVFHALKNQTRNLEGKRRSTTARNRDKVKIQRPRSQEATQLPMAEAVKTWVISLVSIVIKRVTMRINISNPGKTMLIWKISSCLAYTGLE